MRIFHRFGRVGIFSLALLVFVGLVGLFSSILQNNGTVEWENEKQACFTAKNFVY